MLVLDRKLVELSLSKDPCTDTAMLCTNPSFRSFVVLGKVHESIFKMSRVCAILRESFAAMWNHADPKQNSSNMVDMNETEPYREESLILPVITETENSKVIDIILFTSSEHCSENSGLANVLESR